jgi:transposase
MASVVWDRKGVLMVKFMQHRMTIMSYVYCETLRKLHRAIQNKTHGMLTCSVFIVLLHDNACLHTAASTWALLEHFNWELFDHPPYSPDLAPSDYHLFTYLKNWLESQSFNSSEELTGRCQNMTELTSGRLFWHRHTKTYSLILQVPQFWRWLHWEVVWIFLYIITFFFIACFFSSSPEITFWIALIYLCF